MVHCFAYGSLMCEDIMEAASGGRCPSRRAWLEDFSRHPVIGQAYPGIVPAPGGRVEGVVYFGLPPSAWARLDRFEGEEYERRRVAVHLDDGRIEQAWTYVFRPQFAHRLGAGEWDFARFLRSGKARFSAQYLGFDAVKDDGAG